jgi:hypothetical protein
MWCRRRCGRPARRWPSWRCRHIVVFGDPVTGETEGFDVLAVRRATASESATLRPSRTATRSSMDSLTLLSAFMGVILASACARCGGSPTRVASSRIIMSSCSASLAASPAVRMAGAGGQVGGGGEFGPASP